MSATHHGARHESGEHEEVWLNLPFLASGRLPLGLRARVQRHLAHCATCSSELAQQRELRAALLLPQRITYVPGPSLAKLLQRLDAGAAWQAATRPRMSAHGAHPLWRPPGFGWAATLLLLSATAGTWVCRGMPLPEVASLVTALRTRTGLALPELMGPARSAAGGVGSGPPSAPEAASPSVLYISFTGQISVDEVVSMLRTMGAQVVAGPGDSGAFGVIPASPGGSAADAMQRLQELATQLRGDPRVRWVEPLEEALDPRHGELRP